jgi:hypothetical protein
LGEGLGESKAGDARPVDDEAARRGREYLA